MLNSLVFLTTFQCPIKCRFCGYECGPEEAERLAKEDMYRVMDEVARFRTAALVVFSGGEPLLLGQDLLDSVEYATSKGFHTRIVTNAFWAKTPSKAKRTLAALKERGLKEINYSVDDFHQEHIPIEYIKNANDAAEELEIPALLALKTIRTSMVTVDYLEQKLEKKLTIYRKDNENPPNNVISDGITLPVGTDSDSISDDDLTWPENVDNWKGPCDEIMKNVVIAPNLDVLVCCGVTTKDIPEMVLGNLKEKSLVEILRQGDRDMILNWLALEGPFSIMKFINDKCPGIPFREKYLNNCHLCHDLFSRDDVCDSLREYAREKVPDISVKRAVYERFLSEHAEEIAALPGARPVPFTLK